MTWAVGSGERVALGQGWPACPGHGTWRLGIAEGRCPGEGRGHQDCCLGVVLAGVLEHITLACFAFFPTMLGVPRMGTDGWRYKMDFTLATYI